MKYSDQKPPNWQQILEHFKDITWESEIIITYGNTYYSVKDIDMDLQIHEAKHARQQIIYGGPEKWWEKYLADPMFRLSQEVEAYQNQMQWLKARWMNLPRPERKFRVRKMEEWMANTLASHIYGNMITYKKALELIQ